MNSDGPHATTYENKAAFKRWMEEHVLKHKHVYETLESGLRVCFECDHIEGTPEPHEAEVAFLHHLIHREHLARLTTSADQTSAEVLFFGQRFRVTVEEICNR